MAGPQNRSRRGGEDKKNLLLSGIHTLVVQPVILTKQSGLLKVTNVEHKLFNPNNEVQNDIHH